MVNKLGSSGVKIKGLVLGVLLGAVLMLVLTPGTTAQAHCDSRKGPVATAAVQALETGDVTVILPYVAPESEAELEAAFAQALEVRALGGSAQALADEYFIETAVRLHREGEGASYTGLSEEEIPEAIVIADEAMESSSLDAIYTYMDEQMRAGVAEHYQEVVEAREHAEAEGSVEANRERVEAELGFEKYIYNLYLTLTSSVEHEGEGQHQE